MIQELSRYLMISQMIQELSRYLKWFKSYRDIWNDSSVIAISQMIQVLLRYLKWFKSYRADRHKQTDRHYWKQYHRR